MTLVSGRNASTISLDIEKIYSAPAAAAAAGCHSLSILVKSFYSLTSTEYRNLKLRVNAELFYEGVQESFGTEELRKMHIFPFRIHFLTIRIPFRFHNF